MMKFPVNKELFPFQNNFLKIRNGASIHYIDEGSGPVLLMLHGNPTWSFLYRNMIFNLKDRFRCIAPDLPGFGLSIAPTNYDFRAETHYKVLSEFIKTMNLENIIIIGQDWGGPLGLKLAQENKENIIGLILGNTWGWPLKGIGRYEMFSWINGGPIGRYFTRAVNSTWHVFMTFGFHKRIPSNVKQMYKAPFLDKQQRIQSSIFPKELIDAYDFEKEVEENLGKILEIPVLFLWGIHDFAFKTDFLERFLKTFRNTRTYLLEAGHFWQEDQPMASSAKIKEWYGEL